MDVSHLTDQELAKENVRRLLRWYGPRHALQRQLMDYIELSLDLRVPNHCLIFLRPCATSRENMAAHLTEKETEHILGLHRFSDTVLQSTLRTLTAKAEKHSPDELMDEEQDSAQLASRAREVAAEAEETTKAAGEMCSELRGVLTSRLSDEALLHLFDRLQLSEACAVGESGVPIPALAQGVGDLLRQQQHDAPDAPLPQSIIECPSRIMQGLHEFDLEGDGRMNREEFLGFLTRLRA